MDDDNEIENELINNLVNNYEKANCNKIYIENMNGGYLNLDVDDTKSVYVWCCRGVVVNLSGKCNHIFVYKSDDVTLRVDDCISGLTCMKSIDCKILFKTTPMYNIEVSNSDRINIRSGFFNTPMVYKGVTMNIIKSINFKVYEYYQVEDGVITDWNFNFFNF
jgi:hypothetical protein